MSQANTLSETADSTTVATVNDYAALRAFSGSQTAVVVTAQGIAGVFVLDALDTTSDDNGGTIIVAGSARWKRQFTGPASVKWFGAIGNGVADDTASIQAALNWMTSGASLWFNGLNYKISARLLIQNLSGFEIDGQGCTIKAANGMPVISGNHLIAMIDCKDFRLSNLTVDGNRGNRTPAEVPAQNIEFIHCRSFLCERIASNNAVVDGFIFNATANNDNTTYCRDFIMRMCSADNSYRNGVSVINAYNFKFDGGYFTNSNGTSPQCGMDIESNAGATLGNAQGILTGCRFEGNAGFGLTTSGVSGSQEFYIDKCYFSANTLGAISAGANAVHVSYSTFKNHTGSAISQGIVSFTNLEADKSGSVSHCLFTANTTPTACIYTFSTTQGIRITNNTILDHRGAGLNIYGSHQLVSGNTINNCGGIGIASSATDATLSSNTIVGCTGRGIYNSGARPRITGNTVSNIITVAGGYIQTDAANSQVLNNNLTAASAQNDTFGIYLGASQVGSLVSGNVFVNLNAAQPIGFAGSAIHQHTVHSNVGGTANDPRQLISGMALPSYTTGARPTTVLAGQAIYDITLGYPVWYTGSVWHNAAGTVV